jgi:hypothetical protein
MRRNTRQWTQDVDVYGQVTAHGPVEGGLPGCQVYLPLARR